jgi:hypothetical protein
MDMFYVQLACLIASLLLVGFWIYKSKKQVNILSEELMDKKIVINELSEHANRIEKEISSVTEVKPLRTPKKVEKAKTTKKEKVTKSTKTTKPKKVTKK